MNNYKIQIIKNPISKKFYGEIWIDGNRVYRTGKSMQNEILTIRATNKEINIINNTMELKGKAKLPFYPEEKGHPAIEWKNPIVEVPVVNGLQLHKVEDCRFDEDGNLRIKLDCQTRYHSVLTFDATSIAKLKQLLVLGDEKNERLGIKNSRR